MAQQRPRLHRHHRPVVAPRYTLREVVWAVLGFLLLIAIVVVITSLPSRTSATTKTKTKLNSSSKSSSWSNDNNDDNNNDNNNMYQSPDDIPLNVIKSLDAILVLGGGVPESIDKPPVYVQRRCDDAVSVSSAFHESRSRNKDAAVGGSGNANIYDDSDDDTWLPILCLSAGTAHLPQLIGADGNPVWESTACAAYIERQHSTFPLEKIFVETTSYDTIGNAYFTRVAHTDINGWRNLLVVTDDFHMHRTKLIFDWIFGAKMTPTRITPTTSNKKDSKSKKINTAVNHNENEMYPGSSPYMLWYLSTPNVGLTETAITARKEREQQSAATLRTKLIPKYRTLPDIYRFLTHEHALYNAASLAKRGSSSASSTAGGGSSSTSDVGNKIKLSYGGAAAAAAAGGGGSSSDK